MRERKNYHTQYIDVLIQNKLLTKNLNNLKKNQITKVIFTLSNTESMIRFVNISFLLITTITRLLNTSIDFTIKIICRFTL